MKINRRKTKDNARNAKNREVTIDSLNRKALKRLVEITNEVDELRNLKGNDLKDMIKKLSEMKKLLDLEDEVDNIEVPTSGDLKTLINEFLKLGDELKEEDKQNNQENNGVCIKYLVLGDLPDDATGFSIGGMAKLFAGAHSNALANDKPISIDDYITINANNQTIKITLREMLLKQLDSTDGSATFQY